MLMYSQNITSSCLFVPGGEKREGEGEREREGARKGARKEGREQGRDGGREVGREGASKGGREWGGIDNISGLDIFSVALV